MSEGPSEAKSSIWTFNAYMLAVGFGAAFVVGLLTRLPNTVRGVALGIAVLVGIVLVARVVTYLVRRGS